LGRFGDRNLWNGYRDRTDGPALAPDASAGAGRGEVSSKKKNMLIFLLAWACKEKEMRNLCVKGPVESTLSFWRRPKPGWMHSSFYTKKLLDSIKKLSYTIYVIFVEETLAFRGSYWSKSYGFNYQH
jgi:hypothetical protein